MSATVAMGRDEALGRIFRIAREVAGTRPPADFCLRLIHGRAPTKIQSLVDDLEPEWSEHAIASIYTLMLGGERRKELGAYFTPPHLVSHLVDRMRANGLDPLAHSIHDPAAGGAAFVVPLVRLVMRERVGRGEDPLDAMADVAARLSGREIDKGLARVANALIRRILVREFGVEPPSDMRIVREGDSLPDHGETLVDAWVGNPPYAKIGSAGEKVWRGEFADIARGQLNLYAMFLRRGLDRVAPGGLLGFVVPTSFIGSPDYGPFRRRVSELAEVVSIDLIEKRSKVFLDVIQDACFVIVRRRAEPMEAPPTAEVACGVVHAEGGAEALGTALVPSDGSAWRLPARGEEGEGGATLADYGYRAKVGFAVPNRIGARLHKRPAKGRFPLVWAKAVAADGTFDFQRALLHREAQGRLWVDADEDAPYVAKRPLVVVQRTSNRKQTRRINAAAVPKAFLDEHGGLVGENHVLLLVPSTEATPAVSPEDLAALLNSGPVNERFARVCGTVTVSAQLISGLDLPPPRAVKGLARKGEAAADRAVRAAYGAAEGQPAAA